MMQAIAVNDLTRSFGDFVAVDRLTFETVGSRVVVAGTLDDLEDEDEVLEVISEVDGISDIVNRIEIESLG